MRLDLFLKLARLVKRRSMARELCDQSRVQVNSQTAKPAKEIRPGDLVRIRFSVRVIELKVLALPLAGRTVQPEPCYVVTEALRIKESDLP